MMEFGKAEPVRDTLKEPEAPAGEILTNAFIDKHTDFDDFNDMLEAGDFLNEDGEISLDVMVGEMDEFVRSNSSFDSWGQLFKQALEDWWNQSGDNRRDHERRSCDIDVTVEVGATELNGTILDVSRSGMRVETAEEPPNSRTVNVHLPLEPDGDVQQASMVRGAVRWTSGEAPYRLGIEIVERQ